MGEARVGSYLFGTDFKHMSNYRRLDIWKDGCLFAKDVYSVTQNWRDFGLKDQIARSAVSVPSNIAEGSERGSDKEFSRFLYIAKASCEECRTQLYIANLNGSLSYSSFRKLDAQASSISKRIGALIKYLTKS